MPEGHTRGAPGTLDTHRIAAIRLDAERLAADLARADYFAYQNSYSEFICGALRTASLWNQTGEIEEALLRDYAGSACPTAHGKALPYIGELIRELFNTERLKYARLVRLAPGSVLVPHRDYLELDKNFIRIHIPLRTDEACFHAENEKVYQMRRGEVWFLDATQIHSAASFSSADRIHLLLDFIAPDVDSVLRFDADAERSIPESNIVSRRRLDVAERLAFQQLAGVVDTQNYQDVLGLIIKRHFVADFPIGDVFEWMKELAAASGRPEIVAKVTRQHEYCLVRR